MIVRVTPSFVYSPRGRHDRVPQGRLDRVPDNKATNESNDSLQTKRSQHFQQQQWKHQPPRVPLEIGNLQGCWWILLRLTTMFTKAHGEGRWVFSVNENTSSVNKTKTHLHRKIVQRYPVTELTQIIN